jgi:hypothetical protein
MADSRDEMLELYLILGHEVAFTALALRAEYVSAQLRLGVAELIVFTYDCGAVWVTGTGFEIELTRLPEWGTSPG